MTSTQELSRTPLCDIHKSLGGRMVDFAGWEMPIQYSSIVEEHRAVRESVGIFDISHMGRLKITGPDAAKFLDCLLTRQVADMREGQIRYSLVCNADGGILDDVLVYYQRKGEEGPEFLLVVNASNRTKIVDWLKDRIIEFAARLSDITEQTAMIAVQGPQAMRVLDNQTAEFASSLRYYRGGECRGGGIDCYFSRTGYTGEDGGEFICDAEQAPVLWKKLAGLGAKPCGLGARDTLRLEAAMPLYGHELSEEINPIQAGLNFAISLGDREFIGREAIESFAADPNQLMRIGLHVEDRRVAREGTTVKLKGTAVGEVTSGTFSPTLQLPIAMAYVPPQAAATGTQLEVEIRGKDYPAVVVPLPFYQRGQDK